MASSWGGGLGAISRSSRFAWVLCGLIIVGALINIGTALASRSSNMNTTNVGVGIVFEIIPLVFAVLGALILSRQPRNVIGWLLILPALPSGIPVDSYLNSFTGPPPVTPVPLLLALWFNSWNWIILIFPLFFIPLLFPTGQPPSPRWRWVIIFGLAMCAVLFFLATFGESLMSVDEVWSVPNPIGFIPAGVFEKYLIVPWNIGLILMTVLCTASLLLRYRRATLVEREQIKWLLYACGVFATVYLVSLGLNSLRSNLLQGAWDILFVLAILAMPIAITIAILRYRLFDIDVIIRRTLLYGALTLTLGLVYFGSVVLFQELLQGITGQSQSPVATVISTLFIAALFTPLRRRIQHDIDRRFYRKKYDAEKTLAAFAARARDEVELEQLTAHLVSVVQETMQPDRIGLWLKPTKNR
jgi:hypothetical protein